MGLSRTLNRCAAWIACLAILLAALAPSISHAVAAKRASMAALHEICATAGMQADEPAVHGHDSGTPAEPSLHAEHCPFCSTNAFMFALPPAAFDLPLPIGSLLIPALFRASPQPLFAWASAQARAPPRR